MTLMRLIMRPIADLLARSLARPRSSARPTTSAYSPPHGARSFSLAAELLLLPWLLLWLLLLSVVVLLQSLRATRALVLLRRRPMIECVRLQTLAGGEISKANRTN